MELSNIFKGQVALVTGGRSGIGHAITKLLLQQGATVIISSRKERLLVKAAEELSEYGTCLHFTCDIRETDQISALADFIKKEVGKLDILVNNAGGQFPSLAEYINDKGWNAVVNNNLNGTFYMTREMANHFFIPQNKGIITNIIVSLYRGYPGMAHTAAARGGVEALTRTLAIEWSRYNIRINSVAPGIIDSSGLAHYPNQIREAFDKAKEAIPLGRFGKPEEVAQAVSFLSSPLASYTSGITLYVDGAQHLNFDQMGLPNIIQSILSGN